MNEIEYLDKFEASVTKMIEKYLLSKGMVDKILPDAPDIEEKWEQICIAYLPDGVREFNDYPTVSLGWMMFIGMAVAKMWDEDWAKYSKVIDIYTMLRDVRGYDNLDDYICENVLQLSADDAKKISDLVGNTAALVHNALIHEKFEPSTPAAFNAYVRCLHQMYYFGAAVELKLLGYHMTEMPLNNLFDPLIMN